MTISVAACATPGPHEPFTQITIERRDLRPGDVLIDIAYAGICHSDIHHAHNDFGRTRYPLVPGHEIVGFVSAVGTSVTRFTVGERVGVGCMVDACRECEHCRAGFEQFCRDGDVKTAAGIDRDGQPTQGGYSEKIVVDEDFVVRIPEKMALERVAPLLCAGITLYSPLKHWNAGPGKRVGIVGFGGIGHVGVQIAHALGAHTTVLDLSLANRADGLRLGADDYRATTDPDTFRELAESFDLIISTVPANLDMDAYLGLLALDGTIVLLGIPDQPMTVSYFNLVRNRRSIAGSLIGGLAETQEMLDFCAKHGIGAEVEVIGADRIDEAYERLLASQVKYRFVIDVGTLSSDR
jgi:uncharacterized zinc-type alcohol dehydrogenase-like protein